jgi:cardiolipin synthase A/B
VRTIRSQHPGFIRILKIVLASGLVTAVTLAIAQDQETVELRSAVSAADPSAPEYLASLVAADLVNGNSYDVLVNGDRVFPAMLRAIQGARKRISFETYVFEAGHIADQFTTALEEAARRGVTVNMILDALGSGTMAASHLERLQKAGCHIVAFNPTDWYSLEELNYRTHRKILVIDGEEAFTGGVGIADHWMGDAQDAQHWRDTQVRIQGPVARLIEAAFYENFVGGGFTVTPVLSDPRSPSETDDRSMVVRSSPSDGASDLKRLYLLAIAMARRSIAITSPYFVTDESTTWALEDARKRGVAIRILVESDVTDHRSVKYASRAAYTHLLERGIEIYEYQPTMMHTKTLVVDDILSLFGSANFNNRSLELNDEVNVAVMSRQLATRLLQDFAQDLWRSKQLELTSWRRRPLIEKGHELFWSYFGEVF